MAVNGVQGESLYGNDDVVEVTQGTFPGRKDASVWLMEFYAPCAPPAATIAWGCLQPAVLLNVRACASRVDSAAQPRCH